MNQDEAKIYSQKMTYRDAIYNIKQAKGIPYKCATIMKIEELNNNLDSCGKTTYLVKQEFNQLRCHNCDRVFDGFYQDPTDFTFCPYCGLKFVDNED